MRITLEERDVLSLLGKAMNTTLNAEDVEIRTDPFEIIISKAEAVIQEPPPQPSVKPTPRTPSWAPEEENRYDPPLEDLLGASDALAQMGPVCQVRGNEQAGPPPPTERGFER